jgi:hypothetical protein
VNSNLKVFSISFISLHLTGSEPSIDQKKKKIQVLSKPLSLSRPESDNYLSLLLTKKEQEKKEENEVMYQNIFS